MHNIEPREIEIDGLPLAFAQVGAGPDLVYLHGAISTLEDGLIALEDTLASRFRITAFDRPGHGRSGRDASTGSVWRQAELIRAACLELNLDRPVIVAHSFGGAVALAMALASPETVSGLVLIAPVAFPEVRLEMLLFGPRAAPVTGRWASLMAAPADALLFPTLCEGMFLPQRMTKAFRRDFPFALASGRDQLEADGQDALAMIGGLGRSAARYALCEVPVHILQGDRDAVVNPLIHGRPLAAMLPQGRFVNLPGLGHMAHHFAPDAVADSVAAVHRPGAG